MPAFKVLVPASGYFPEVHETGLQVITHMQDLGLRPDMVTHPDFAAFTEQWRSMPDWGIAMAGYVPREDRLEPSSLLQYWTCAEISGGGNNQPGYCNEEYDRIYKIQNAIFNPEERKPHVFKLQELLAKDLPAIVQMHQHVRMPYNKERWGNVVSMAGIGPWNTYNLLQATPRTSNTVMKVGFVLSLRPLNPMLNSQDSLYAAVISLLYDTLVRQNLAGTPEPWAAESWKQVNDVTLDMTLRQGMKFHDGRPVTADDVVFSFEYIKKHKPVWYVGYMRPISRVEKVNDRTVRIHLTDPFAPLLSTSLTRIPILPKHVWESVTDPGNVQQVNTVGSGPYKFRSWVPEQSYRLERNADHFMAPKASELLISKYANQETQFLGLARGEIDFVERAISPQLVTEALRYPHLGVFDEPSIDVRNMIFNMREGLPFRDFPLRQAVAHLLDFKLIEEVIGKGMVQAGRGIIAPANKFYHNPNQKLPSFDPKQARRILTAAGYAWDREGRLYYPSNHKPQVLPK